MTFKPMQKDVDEWIRNYTPGYFEPLMMMARLTEELGELSRAVTHRIGMKKPKPGEDAGDVFDGFALAEADFFLAEHDGRAAEMLHGDGEADTGTQAGFFEDHRQHFAGQDGIVAAGGFVLLLEAQCDIECHVLFGDPLTGNSPAIVPSVPGIDHYSNSFIVDPPRD